MYIVCVRKNTYQYNLKACTIKFIFKLVLGVLKMHYLKQNARGTKPTITWKKRSERHLSQYIKGNLIQPLIAVARYSQYRGKTSPLPGQQGFCTNLKELELQSQISDFSFFCLKKGIISQSNTLVLDIQIPRLFYNCPLGLI